MRTKPIGRAEIDPSGTEMVIKCVASQLIPATFIASVIDPLPAPRTQATAIKEPTIRSVRTALHPAANAPAIGPLSLSATASARLRATRVQAWRVPPSGAGPDRDLVGGRDPLPASRRAALRCSARRYAMRTRVTRDRQSDWENRRDPHRPTRRSPPCCPFQAEFRAKKGNTVGICGRSGPLAIYPRGYRS